MSEVIMLVGLPASGKSTVVNKYPNHYRLNRDTTGGNLDSLLPKMRECLKTGQNVILDNLNATIASRKPFIDVAKEFNSDVFCEWLTTTPEDCQINALMRMHNRYGRLFLHQDDIKNHPDAKKDSNIFPITVIFHYKKIFEKPTLAEGFSTINKIGFIRKWDSSFVNKALFLDYDDTLRHVENGEYHFPTKKEEVTILPNVKTVLQKYVKDGYILLGVSNQSGIARRQVTNEQVIECIEETNRQIGLDIYASYCCHNVPPVCYCRKPQSGLAVQFIVKHKIDVTQSLMVGDKTTDCTFAERLGMKFSHAEDFFNRR